MLTLKIKLYQRQLRQKTCITQLFIETKISNDNYRKQANRKRSREDVFIISTRNFKIAGESKSSPINTSGV